jgi:hypothetical protein
VIRIGPEIVNKLEVFAPVVLCIEGRDHDVIWPEDVPPRAGAALTGALKASSTTKPVADETTRLVGRKAATEDMDDPASDLQTDAGSEGAEDTVASSASNAEAASASRRRALIGALLGVVITALAVTFILLRSAEDTAEAPEAPTVAEVAAEDPDCSLETLSSLPGGFAATTEALTSSCDTVMDAETGFRLVERGTEAGDGEAWLALGGLYDPANTVPVFEDRLGIAPGVNLPLAAEYYATARAAGAAGATDRLIDVCTRLAGLTDTLSIGARNDFCP